MFDEVFHVKSGKFRRYHGESFISHLLDIKTLLLNARDLVRVIYGTFEARRLLKKLQPSVVFSKGGYVVVPVGIASHLLKIPIVTHDSDTLPGMANRIIGRWATIHATGMPSEYYDYPKEKLVYTGIPVSKTFHPPTSKEIADFKNHLKIPINSKVLLVAGGGQGSKTVNAMILEVANDLLKKFPDLYLLHLCGKANQTDVREGYKDNLSADGLLRVKVVGFTDEFFKFSAVADLVVARTGATTLAELAMQGRALITIPSPFLSGGHQLKNAEMLKKQQASVIVKEDSSRADLLEQLDDLLSDEQKRKELASNLHKLAKPEAAQDIANILFKVANNK